MKDEKEAILDGSMDRSSGCPPNRYVYAEEVQLMSVISLLTYIWIIFFPLLPLLLLLLLPSPLGPVSLPPPPRSFRQPNNRGEETKVSLHLFLLVC